MKEEKIATWYERYLILFNPSGEWDTTRNLHLCDDARFAYMRVPNAEAAKEIARHMGFKYVSAPQFAVKVSVSCGLAMLVGRTPALNSFKEVFKRIRR